VQFVAIDGGEESIVEAGIDNFFIQEGEFIGLPEAKATPPNDVRLYPNPADHQLTFDFGRPVQGMLKLLNIQGQEVYSFNIEQSVVTLTLPQKMGKGLYLYRFPDNRGGHHYQGKFIKN
jgi:hypothetical protein